MEWLGSASNVLWQPLLLLLVANGAPILAQDLLGGRFSSPLDRGALFFDGRPLFGATKSWRGVVSAIFATTVAASLLGMTWSLGLLFALLSMLGDLLSSFSKRRLAIAPQGRAPGLDQIPEALLPLWLLRDALSLGGWHVVAAVVLFMAVEMIVSPLLYRLNIRLRPY